MYSDVAGFAARVPRYVNYMDDDEERQRGSVTIVGTY